MEAGRILFYVEFLDGVDPQMVAESPAIPAPLMMACPEYGSLLNRPSTK